MNDDQDVKCRMESILQWSDHKVWNSNNNLDTESSGVSAREAQIGAWRLLILLESELKEFLASSLEYSVCLYERL